MPSLLGWSPSLLGWRPSLLGWRPSLVVLIDYTFYYGFRKPCDHGRLKMSSLSLTTSLHTACTHGSCQQQTTAFFDMVLNILKPSCCKLTRLCCTTSIESISVSGRNNAQVAQDFGQQSSSVWSAREYGKEILALRRLALELLFTDSLGPLESFGYLWRHLTTAKADRWCVFNLQRTTAEIWVWVGPTSVILLNILKK